ncbi:MAG: hypothetical protein MJ200_01300 [Mycoplasmoidaceae bacterium]|nr:hypothetical protein [Mycoplasmoidaceae bacterium]
MPTDRSLCCREGQPHDFETEDAQYAYFANQDNIGDSPVEDQDGDDIMFSCLQLKDLVNGFYFMQLGSVILNDDDEV